MVNTNVLPLLSQCMGPLAGHLCGLDNNKVGGNCFGSKGSKVDGYKQRRQALREMFLKNFEVDFSAEDGQPTVEGEPLDQFVKRQFDEAVKPSLERLVEGGSFPVETFDPTLESSERREFANRKDANPKGIGNYSAFLVWKGRNARVDIDNLQQCTSHQLKESKESQAQQRALNVFLDVEQLATAHGENRFFEPTRTRAPDLDQVIDGLGTRLRVLGLRNKFNNFWSVKDEVKRMYYFKLDFYVLKKKWPSTKYRLKLEIRHAWVISEGPGPIVHSFYVYTHHFGNIF